MPETKLIGKSASLNVNMPQNESVTIEMRSEENENSDSNSDQPASRSKRKFTWSSLGKYLRETWTGVISGTGRIFDTNYAQYPYTVR